MTYYKAPLQDIACLYFIDQYQTEHTEVRVLYASYCLSASERFVEFHSASPMRSKYRIPTIKPLRNSSSMD